MSEDDIDDWSQALADVKEWFEDHDGGAIVANLAGPVTDTKLAELETRLGAPLPESLRWLYSIHAGQPEREANPLFEDLVFCDPDYALALRDGMVIAYFNPPKYFDPQQPLRDTELTQRWYPLANTSHAFLAVNLDSGRVVLADKSETPALRVVADSVGALLFAYAGALWDDKYRFERFAKAKRGAFRF